MKHDGYTFKWQEPIMWRFPKNEDRRIGIRKRDRAKRTDKTFWLLQINPMFK